MVKPFSGGGVIEFMTNLDPCLRGCDLALAEADLLIELLSEGCESLDPELTAVRRQIARLRGEVDRLRGMPTLPTRRRVHPDWTDLASASSPWAARGVEQIGGGPAGGR